MQPMRKSRLSDYKQDRLIEHFVAGTTARTAACLCGVNRKTTAFFYHRLREVVALELEAESEAMFGGEIEVDESYFGGKRKGLSANSKDKASFVEQVIISQPLAPPFLFQLLLYYSAPSTCHLHHPTAGFFSSSRARSPAPQ